ncbi:MAG: hypothetical protein V4534_06315 [Myxococcota bacterium]
MANNEWMAEGIIARSWGDPQVVNSAQFYCENLIARGHYDWHLPRVGELKELPRLKLQTAGSLFWSNDPEPLVGQRKAKRAYAFDLVTGQPLLADINFKLWVICVRETD